MTGMKNFNWICLGREYRPTMPLTQYGFLAEKHWREFLPTMVAELERKGNLRVMLQEAEERTATEMDELRCDFLGQGLTAEQAQQQAWELVRERYLFLPPES
jgi:hypothetical protein